MSNLKVIFEDPEGGGIWIQLHSATQSVNFSATYHSYGFFALVDALYRIYGVPGQIILGEQQEEVEWLCEPGIVTMRFSRKGEVIHLDILSRRPSRRNELNQPEPELSIAGSYEEVCLPFWRALRHLQSRFSVSEFRARWYGPFPMEEMLRLTQALGK